jgi:hypothetical protein
MVEQTKSKNALERDRKKLVRKQQTAIHTLCKGEDLSYEQLTVAEPTGKMLVTHFGSGDEKDQDLLIDFCSKFGSVKSITVLPGTNYAHIEYASSQSAADLLLNITGPQEKQTNTV